MSSEDSDKLRLLPEATQSSYERVLEWQTETEREEAHPIPFLRRPVSVPSDEHHPQGLGALRDDMALPRTDSNDVFDVTGYGQWAAHTGDVQMGHDDVSEFVLLLVLKLINGANRIFVHG
jgi:hypothetical protein